MGKYKVGDEVLVKARINDIRVEDRRPYAVKSVDNTVYGDAARVIYVREEDVLPSVDMTAEEAWDIARKIVLLEDEGGISVKDIVEMFGVKFTRDIIKEYSVHEVKAKIDAWKAEKEIKVGDVVDICGDKGIITSFGTDGDMIHVLYLDGIVNSYRKDKDIKKTGQHINIGGILKQIGGDE